MKSLRLSFLVEDSVSPTRRKAGFRAEHGLSVLVEGARPKLSLLMDTGPSPDVLLNNAEILGVDFDRLDAVFLSHGHYDHTGGLSGVLSGTSKKITVIAHPSAFEPKFAMAPKLRYVGAPFGRSEFESSARALLVRNPVKIVEGVMTTGEVERITSYERPRGFWTVEGEMLLEDHMKDDQGLVVNLEDRGLVVISGCAHAGIVNVVKQAQRLAGVDRVHAVIGGFHLKNSSESTIMSTVNDLVEIKPDIVCPCHCTGQRAIRKLKLAFGDGCRILGTGEAFEI